MSVNHSTQKSQAPKTPLSFKDQNLNENGLASASVETLIENVSEIMRKLDFSDLSSNLVLTSQVFQNDSSVAFQDKHQAKREQLLARLEERKAQNGEIKLASFTSNAERKNVNDYQESQLNSVYNAICRENNPDKGISLDRGQYNQYCTLQETKESVYFVTALEESYPGISKETIQALAKTSGIRHECSGPSRSCVSESEYKIKKMFATDDYDSTACYLPGSTPVIVGRNRTSCSPEDVLKAHTQLSNAEVRNAEPSDHQIWEFKGIPSSCHPNLIHVECSDEFN